MAGQAASSGSTIVPVSSLLDTDRSSCVSTIVRTMSFVNCHSCSPRSTSQPARPRCLFLQMEGRLHFIMYYCRSRNRRLHPSRCLPADC